MALKPIAPITVFISKPVEMSVADAMRGLRTWLDHRKIQPTEFKFVTRAQIGFQITFMTELDAHAFRRFKWRP